MVGGALAVRAAPGDTAARHALARRAEGVLADIASALSEPAVGAGLSSGNAGVALFHAAVGGDATPFVDRAIEALAARPTSSGLFEGFTGVAWTLNELTDDGAPEIDELVATHLARSWWDGHVDLAAGLAGLAVYALARLPRPPAIQSLHHVITHLERRAHAMPDGIAWQTPARLLSASARERSPEGHFDLGLAHGAAGIVAVLARILAADIARTRTRALLDGAVAWLLARGGADGYGRWWDGRATHPGRLGWCYGDLSVAVALWAAARATGDAAQRAAALALVDDVAGRPVDACGIDEPGLCHGAFGLAHIFHRFHRVTDSSLHRRAAIAWIERGLALRTDEGLAGFRVRERRQDGALHMIGAPGLVDGAAGIGLVLHAALGGASPWDRVLLLDLDHSTWSRRP